MIETPRLLLRPYTPADVDALLPILTDPTTMRFWPRPYTPDEVAGWVERAIASYAAHGFGRLAMIERESGTLVGDCGLMRTVLDGREVVDLGYIVHHPYWRRGYAVEAATAVRDLAFGSLGIDRLVANMADDHLGSARVAEKIGMVEVGTFHNPRNRNLRTRIFAIERPAA